MGAIRQVVLLALMLVALVTVMANARQGHHHDSHGHHKGKGWGSSRNQEGSKSGSYDSSSGGKSGSKGGSGGSSSGGKSGSKGWSGGISSGGKSGSKSGGKSGDKNGGNKGSCEKCRRDPLDRPNFVLFFADDMGYGDLASYGHPTQERGAIDDVMVAGGIRFTEGYVPDAVCTPSRTALLTGRYPARVGVYGRNRRVFLPNTRTGLPRSEVTLAEALKTAGYTTGITGKWHLGINAASSSDGAHLPMNHGFDFVGHILPFTNSFSCDESGRFQDSPDPANCFLYKRDQFVAQPFNHTYLTQTFVNDALNFIGDNAEQPFFFYFALAKTHVSLFASPKFAGKSRRGEYGDNVNELNDAVSQVLAALEAKGLSRNTLVVFISDNGPEVSACVHGGDPGILKGYKTNSWEGGVRVPFVAYWPGMIKPRVSNEVVSSLDIIQTFVDLAGAKLPDDRDYDGKALTDVFLHNAPSPHDILYFYCQDRLMAVRAGPYKIHYFTQRLLSQDYYASLCQAGGLPGKALLRDCLLCYDECVQAHCPPLVYNIENDPTESYPLDASTKPALQRFLTTLQRKVDAHVASMVIPDPLLDDTDDTGSIAPCCDADSACVCNYGSVKGPYN